MARNYQHWLKAYLDFTNDSESPTEFHFWTGVSTLAGALRRRVWIDMKKFQWTPNFYIILVGPPGLVKKSTSLGIGMRLLGKIKGIHFGPESMTWQALGDTLQASTEFFEYINELGVKVLGQMSTNTIQISELGTFLRTDDDQLISFLIRMWDGQLDTFRHSTKSSGKIEVENPWLNIIGATTPSWLQENVPESMIGGGLMSRVVFVFSEKMRKLVPYPDEWIAPDEHAKMEKALLEDLLEISTLAGPYSITDEARRWGREWYEQHYDISKRPAHLSSDRLGGYLSRKQTHIHKFAIILAAAKRSNLVVELEDLIEADGIITSTERDMLRVFESIGVVVQRRHIKEIVSFVRFAKALTAEELWYRSMNMMSLKDFQEACRAAVQAKVIKLEVVGGVSKFIIDPTVQ